MSDEEYKAAILSILTQILTELQQLNEYTEADDAEMVYYTKDE